MRPMGVPGLGRRGKRLRTSSKAIGTLCVARRCKASPSQRKILPNLASQMRTALVSIVPNTGSRSPGELLITWSTSDVAVCCSSNSVSSRVRCCSASNSRVFSIAITAWSAKVSASSICLSVKGRTDFRPKVMAPIGDPSRRSGTPRSVRDVSTFRYVYSGSARTSRT